MKDNVAGVRVFGHLPDGTAVHATTLEIPSGVQAEILSYGGILRRLRVPRQGKRIDVVLGLPDLASYILHRWEHMGALVGRYANRIRHARFMLGTQEYKLDRNEGKNHLHGGAQGFAHQCWMLDEVSATHLVLRYESAAGEQGYPGHLSVKARYEVIENGLQLTYHAQTDATTLVNLTHHPYFNLSGNPTLPADRQWVTIPADNYLPMDAEFIPLGEIACVNDTPFDFRKPRRLSDTDVGSHEQLRIVKGYGHCMVLQAERPYCAELTSPDSGITMQMSSPKPGLQLYGGQGLPKELGISGLCLEPQYFPDSPNHAHFPSALLHPGQEYIHRIDYQFMLSENRPSPS